MRTQTISWRRSRFHQRLEHYSKELDIPHQAPQFSITPGEATAASPGVEPSTSAGVAPDAPRHEAASTRFNLRVEETFDSTHGKGESATDPPATCVDFTYADRDSFRFPEEENRVIKIPNKITRCHPLLRAVSPGIAGASASGNIGASSPGGIGASATGITTSTSSGITGASVGVTGSTTSDVLGESPPGTAGPSFPEPKHKYQPSAEEGPHAYNSGRTPAG